MHPRDREIIKRYRAGKSAAELAPEFGLGVSGILRVLERHGVKRRPKGRRIRLAGEWLKG